MEDFERERLEQILEAITIASDPEAVRAEIADLKELAAEAHEIENAMLLCRCDTILEQYLERTKRKHYGFLWSQLKKYYKACN